MAETETDGCEIVVDVNDPQMVALLDAHEVAAEEYNVEVERHCQATQEFGQRVFQERQEYAARRVAEINAKLAEAKEKERAQQEDLQRSEAMRKFSYVCAHMNVL